MVGAMTSTNPLLSAVTIADNGIRLDKGPSRLGNTSSLLEVATSGSTLVQAVPFSATQSSLTNQINNNSAILIQ